MLENLTRDEVLDLDTALCHVMSNLRHAIVALNKGEQTDEAVAHLDNLREVFGRMQDLRVKTYGELYA